LENGYRGRGRRHGYRRCSWWLYFNWSASGRGRGYQFVQKGQCLGLSDATFTFSSQVDLVPNDDAAVVLHILVVQRCLLLELLPPFLQGYERVGGRNIKEQEDGVCPTKESTREARESFLARSVLFVG
jgi:hypothetical protein